MSLKSMLLDFRNILTELIDIRIYFLRLFKRSSPISKKLRQDGVVVLPNYYSKDICRSCIYEIEESLLDERVMHYTDEIGSDTRIFGFNEISESSNIFLNDIQISDISREYLGYKNNARFVLAAKLKAKEGNLGSGGGWHRDNSVIRQFKAIIYLTDVADCNGPFQYIKGSHRLWSRLKFWIRGNKFYETRYSEKNVANSSCCSDVVTVVGQSGDLILVDTKGVHRGKPIQSNVRFALTMYSWKRVIPSHIEKLIN